MLTQSYELVPRIDVIPTQKHTWKPTQQLMDAFKSLTPREIQVIRGFAVGKDLKTVAGELRISTHTVQVHRDKIRDKLGLKGEKMQPLLAVVAVVLGLVTPKDYSFIEQPSDDLKTR